MIRCSKHEYHNNKQQHDSAPTDFYSDECSEFTDQKSKENKVEYTERPRNSSFLVHSFYDTTVPLLDLPISLQDF